MTNLDQKELTCFSIKPKSIKIQNFTTTFIFCELILLLNLHNFVINNKSF